jgi:hypothetical protein
VARLGAQRDIGDGKGELEADVGYVSSKDDNAGTACVVTMLATCWGSSQVTTISLDGVGSYRLGRDWFGVASLELAQQSFTVSDATTTVKQPGVVMITGLVRLAYRF